MSQALMFGHIALAVPRVMVSRLRRGPARPTWSFGFEVATSALKSISVALAARSWAEQRIALDAMANLRSPVLRSVTRTAETIAGVPCEWFAPKDRDPSATTEGEPTVLYFHGGSYIYCSTVSHGELIARIALATNARVLAPNYRLAPENPFPAGLDDAGSVYCALLATGVAPSSVVIGGDSAGAGLAAALLLRLRDANEPLPAGAFLICPWVDLTAKGGSLAANAAFDWGTAEIVNSWVEPYVGSHDPADPLISPALAPDLSGLPPLLVQVGGAELLLDQATTLARRAKEQGTDARLVIEEDMVHDWHTFAGFFAACGKPIDEIGAFTREVAGEAR